MISWVVPQKPTDDNERSNYQPLPSTGISEFISGDKLSSFPPTPSSTLQHDTNLPWLLAAAHRPYPETGKHSSPQTQHTTLSFFLGQDALPASDSPRPPFSSLPSLPRASDRRPSRPSKPDLPPHHDLEPQKPPEPLRPFNEVYAHPPSPPPALVSYQPDQPSPSQITLPACPISSQHTIPPHGPRPYDPRPVPHAEEEVNSAQARSDATVNGHFESWIYEDSLSRVGNLSRTILNFAEAYSRIALEQHGAHSIPERLPTEREVSNMLENVELTKRWLEQVKDLVYGSIQNQEAGGRAEMKGPFEEEHDVLMAGEGLMPQHDSVKFKKRFKKRRRPPPTPGRCHSCNTMDTPEWRRGPNGARTLCNACGLHYAKLERKRHEARLLRPTAASAYTGTS